jgi:hypothetical protein
MKRRAIRNLDCRKLSRLGETEYIDDGFDQIRFACAVLANDHGRETAFVKVGLHAPQVLEPVDVDPIEAHQAACRV